MTLETITCDRFDDGVAVVTLNRPDVHNAFNETMQRELRDTWHALRTDAAVRAVVLTAAGDKSFSTTRRAPHSGAGRPAYPRVLTRAAQDAEGRPLRERRGRTPNPHGVHDCGSSDIGAVEQSEPAIVGDVCCPGCVGSDAQTEANTVRSQEVASGRDDGAVRDGEDHGPVRTPHRES